MCLVLVAAASASCYGQSQPLEILNSDITSFEKSNAGASVRKLIGNVHVRQDTNVVWCDSAYYYKDRNVLDAFSRVHVQMGDSINLYADRASYDGNTKIAEVYSNIRLTDGKATLTTNRMTYYRNQRYGYYQGGGQLKDSSSTLTSLQGYYYSNRAESLFKDSVKLAMPEYMLYADSLRYRTGSKTAVFVAPTRMYGKTPAKKNEMLYTEGGYYDSRGKETFLYQNPFIRDSASTTWADSIYYRDRDDKGWAHCRVQILTNDSALFIGGDKVVFKRKKRWSLVTENPFVLQKGENDTLALFADTLFVQEDSLRITEAPDTSVTPARPGRSYFKKYQPMRAYHNVRFAMREMQGVADSLEYERVDSVITLYREPAVWAKENQLTGDTIRIWMKQKMADSLRVYGNGFIASRETAKFFNQIQSDQIYGKFKKNKLQRMLADIEAEVVYFTKDKQADSSEKLTGVNRGTSASLLAFFKDNKPQKFILIKGVSGKYSPIHEVVLNPPRLSRFNWRGGARPFRYLGTLDQNYRQPDADDVDDETSEERYELVEQVNDMYAVAHYDDEEETDAEMDEETDETLLALGADYNEPLPEADDIFDALGVDESVSYTLDTSPISDEALREELDANEAELERAEDAMGAAVKTSSR